MRRWFTLSHITSLMITSIIPSIKIKEQEHLIQPLRVHSLLPDFKLEDVWRVPVTLAPTHSLQVFMHQFKVGEGKTVNRGMAGFLFRIRLSLGKVLKWDEKEQHDHLVPGSIRFRYAQQEGLTYPDLPAPGSGSFIPVFQLENEFLSEIENATVHAALHFSRVPAGPDVWTIHMAVYVKPKGWFGRLYMVLIKPFRLWIVYPALMNALRNNWEAYLKSSPHLAKE